MCLVVTALVFAPLALRQGAREPRRVLHHAVHPGQLHLRQRGAADRRLRRGGHARPACRTRPPGPAPCGRSTTSSSATSSSRRCCASSGCVVGRGSSSWPCCVSIVGYGGWPQIAPYFGGNADLMYLLQLIPFFLAGSFLYMVKDKFSFTWPLALAGRRCRLPDRAQRPRLGSAAGGTVPGLRDHVGRGRPARAQAGAEARRLVRRVHLRVPVQQLLALAGLYTLNLAVYDLLAIVCTLPLAIASWLLIERPVLRRARKVTTHARPPAVLAPVNGYAPVVEESTESAPSSAAQTDDWERATPMTTTKRALITGITGQDGSYLAELLLSKGYEVHGLIRRASTFNTRAHRPHLPGSARPEPPALPALRGPHRRLAPRHAAQRDPARRGLQPRRAVPRARQLRRARVHRRLDRPGHDPPARGHPRRRHRRRGSTRPAAPRCSARPRRRRTRTRRSTRAPRTASPRSTRTGSRATTARPTASSPCNGILFNHESPRRGGTFVTRKITRAVARIAAGPAGRAVHGQPRRRARLGLRPRVRRGHVADAPARRAAGLRASPPARRTRCSDFLQFSFEHVGLDWEKYVKFDERYLRPTEVDALIGDPSKAQRLLGWTPKVLTPRLAEIMVDADIAALETEGRHYVDEVQQAARRSARRSPAGVPTTCSPQTARRPHVRVLLTGGAGMLGRSLVDGWAQQRPDDELIVVTRADVDLRDAVRPRAALLERDARPRRSSTPPPRSAASRPSSPRPPTYLLREPAARHSVIGACIEAGVPELLYVGSAAVYPDRYERPYRRVRRSVRPSRGRERGLRAREDRRPPGCASTPASSTACTTARRCRRTSTARTTTSGTPARTSIAAALGKMHARTSRATRRSRSGATARRGGSSPTRRDLAAWLVDQVGRLADWPDALNLGCGTDHSIAEYYEVARRRRRLPRRRSRSTPTKPSGMPRRLHRLRGARARSAGRPRPPCRTAWPRRYAAYLAHHDRTRTP